MPLKKLRVRERGLVGGKQEEREREKERLSPMGRMRKSLREP